MLEICNNRHSYSDPQLMQTGKVLCWIKPDVDPASWGSKIAVYFPLVWCIQMAQSLDRVCFSLPCREESFPSRILILWEGEDADLYFFSPAPLVILFFFSYHSCDSDERRHLRLQSAPCCHAGSSRGYSHSCYCRLQKQCALLGNESWQCWG